MNTRLMSADDFDAAELEDGIRDVVVAMRQAGFDTHGSCQGGKGHPHLYPTVLVWCEDPEESRRLSEWSQKHMRGHQIRIAERAPGYVGKFLTKWEMFVS